MIHYNNKYEKEENFFSNIVDEKDTNSQMELFYETIVEFNMLKDKFETIDIFYYYVDYIDKKNVKKMIDENDGQIHCLEIIKDESTITKIISPSMLTLLCYIINNLYAGEPVFLDKLYPHVPKWSIYNLKTC